MDKKTIRNRNKRIRKKLAKLHRKKDTCKEFIQDCAQEGESSQIATSSPCCSKNGIDFISSLYGIYQGSSNRKRDCHNLNNTDGDKVPGASLSASHLSSHIRFCQDDAFSGVVVNKLGMNRENPQQAAESVVSGQVSEIRECIVVVQQQQEEGTVSTAAAAAEGAMVTERSQHNEEVRFDYGVVLSTGVSRKVFVHGNYHRYYGYRLGKAFEEDPRLGLLEKQWFHKKRCLDIGCNEGIVTLSIAKAFGTKSMTGIDLDEHLIKRACSHLKDARSEAIETFVLSQKSGIDSKSRKDAKRTMQSLAQTWFVHGNFLAGRVDKGSFDCITAFSVTKWVHLHGGDSGIRYFFKKISELLSPGGRFILEPQSWKSYKSAASKMRRSMGEKSQIPEYAYFFRLQDLQIRPEEFCSILPLEFGLKFIRRLDPPSQTAEGFDRHMYMFQKC